MHTPESIRYWLVTPGWSTSWIADANIIAICSSSVNTFWKRKENYLGIFSLTNCMFLNVKMNRSPLPSKTSFWIWFYTIFRYILYFYILNYCQCHHLTLWSTSYMLPRLPRDARSASAVLLSYVVRPSIRLSVCLSVTLMYRGHIGWTSSKVIKRIISLGSSLLGAITSAI